jgi:hypothetical protein
MATTYAELSTRGPPESPGCNEASVWTSPESCSELSSTSSLAVMVWFRAVTFPVVTLGVPPVPPAFPMAVTACPSVSFEELPTLTVASPDTPGRRSNAMSFVLSVPTTEAE